MKKVFLIILLVYFGTNAYCQDNVIKLGSEVTLQLKKDSSGKYNYQIISNKPMKKSIELDNDLLKGDIDSTQVKLVFGKGKFGSNPEIFLIIKSGLKNTLSYAARIKTDGHDFHITDVNPLIPKVKSMETWADNISEIILFDFKVFNVN
jgi:hypothetical protein